MNIRESILKSLTEEDTAIFSYEFSNKDQLGEIEMRKSKVNKLSKEELLNNISKAYSIPVMNQEVVRFLKHIPVGGIILDVGGGVGWHWMDLDRIRPDVTVVIVDIVKENFNNAKTILGDLLNHQIFLVHGDATNLPFDEEVFDGYWTVQVFQHIPQFPLALKEAGRVLKKGGYFSGYWLNNQKLIKFLYKVLGKKYHEKGVFDGHFYLERAGNEHQRIISEVFGNSVKKRFTEIFMLKELGFCLSGKIGFFGYVDVILGRIGGLFSAISRQRSFHVKKK